MNNKEVIINKVEITPEAKIDYEIIAEGKFLDAVEFRKEINEYLLSLYEAGKLNKNYFHVKYYDESLDQMLLLFFYKGYKFQNMQVWDLSGICIEDDYTSGLEDEGQIRSWLMTKIDDNKKNDWVETMRFKLKVLYGEPEEDQE